MAFVHLKTTRQESVGLGKWDYHVAVGHWLVSDGPSAQACFCSHYPQRRISFAITLTQPLPSDPYTSYQQSSLRPANARQSVGDGASSFDTAVPDGLGGAFDAPKVKCPPDRGSLDCVTGSPAPYLSPSSPSSLSSSPIPASPVSNMKTFTKSIAYSPTTAAPITTIDYTHGQFHRPRPSIVTSSRPIPTPARSSSSPGYSTPPLTPDDGSYSSSGSIDSIGLNSPIPTAVHQKQKPGGGVRSKDALEYLMTLFPKDGLKALPHAKSVSLTAPALGADFEGVVLELPGKPKTLYIDGKNAASVSLRESVVALLDLAADNLDCGALVIVLERSAPNLGELLHSLMYVGGSVVTKPPFFVDPAFILVGLEI
ncbi:hypothetical protein Agabi119p4_1896 [Agaricus bisporus var. burnettii]|uniref:Ornithine decarboxylase antizyme n=1 Tax=Agaricus bisporus var. burnettii TaxID=192524 RepID=A0A8H7KJV0_AGABI|nr:hypothetical protein Agabi119p4_1896 [Agaricus bisporus var. burnettii]